MYSALTALIVIAAVAGGGYFVYLFITEEQTVFSVEYELNGGINSSANPLTYDSTVGLSLDYPTKYGESFLGWYSDPGFTNYIDNIEAGTKGDVKLYAKWGGIVGKGFILDFSGTYYTKNSVSECYSENGSQTYRYMYRNEEGSYLIESQTESFQKNISGGRTVSETESIWDLGGYSTIDHFTYEGKEIVDGKTCEHYIYYHKDGMIRNEWIVNGWTIYKMSLYRSESSVTYSSDYILNKVIDFEARSEYRVNAYSDEGIVAKGSGSFAPGSQVEVSAEMEDGAEFGGWYDFNGNLVSKSPKYILTMGDRDVSLVARNNSDFDYRWDKGRSYLPHGSEYMEINWIVLNEATGDITRMSGLKRAYDFDKGGYYSVFLDGKDEFEKDIFGYYRILIDSFDVVVYTSDKITVTGEGAYNKGNVVTLEAKMELGTQFRGWYSMNGTYYDSTPVYNIPGLNDHFTVCAVSTTIEHAELGSAVLHGFAGLSPVRWIVQDLLMGKSYEVLPGDDLEVKSGGEFLVCFEGLDDIGNAEHRCYTMKVDGEMKRTFDWDFNGKHYSLTVGITEEDYKYFSTKDTDKRIFIGNDANKHNKEFITYKDSQFVKKNTIAQIASDLGAIAENEGLDDNGRAGLILAFVQSIEYQEDQKSMKTEEYWRFPLETLYEQIGDDEDKAFVYLSIIKASGYGSSILFMYKHIAGGIDLEGWKYCECATVGYGLAEIPVGVTFTGKTYSRGATNYCNIVEID